MRHTLSALAITAASIISVPATAQQQLTNEKSVIEGLSIDNVSEILREMGALEVAPSTGSGGKGLTFKDGPIPYNMALVGCDKAPGCIATIIFVIIDGGTANYPLDSFNSFNKDRAFVSAVKLEENKYAVSRMIMTAGGITKKNFAVNVGTFTVAPGELMKFLSSQLVAGYQDGRAAQFQRTSFGFAPPRAVHASPRDIALVLESMKFDAPKATLRR